ncbi:MAG: hypothetical protein MMC33_010239 [Icmadophila ericetorum]|nr:hypothetical protein [Icmadophila ericetorum]
MVQDKSRTSYHEFMHLDQAGPAIIVQDNMDRREFVAIKRIKRIASTPVYTVPAFESNQIVNIKEMFLEGDNLITVVYEQMDVSLRHIMAVKGGPLEAFEIAAICQDIVNGLLYIHEKLLLYYGTLGCSAVLLNQDGEIKIANVAEAILERKVFSAVMAMADIKCIGTIMMELMEPATSILDPCSTVLKNPEKWRDESGIKDFLAATQDNNSLRQLKETHGSCLRCQVFAAIRAAKIPWDMPLLL